MITNRYLTYACPQFLLSSVPMRLLQISAIQTQTPVEKTWKSFSSRRGSLDRHSSSIAILKPRMKWFTRITAKKNTDMLCYRAYCGPLL